VVRKGPDPNPRGSGAAPVVSGVKSGGLGLGPAAAAAVAAVLAAAAALPAALAAPCPIGTCWGGGGMAAARGVLNDGRLKSRKTIVRFHRYDSCS